MDNRARRSKGIAYIEFQELDSVPKAMALNGHKLLGVPIIIQPSHGDRNRWKVRVGWGYIRSDVEGGGSLEVRIK